MPIEFQFLKVEKDKKSQKRQTNAFSIAVDLLMKGFTRLIRSCLFFCSMGVSGEIVRKVTVRQFSGTAYSQPGILLTAILDSYLTIVPMAGESSVESVGSMER